MTWYSNLIPFFAVRAHLLVKKRAVSKEHCDLLCSWSHLKKIVSMTLFEKHQDARTSLDYPNEKRYSSVNPCSNKPKESLILFRIV